MIEKMQFVSITGPKTDIDRMVDKYLSRYEIQLENALSELRSVKDLRPITEVNPYRELCGEAASLAEPLKAGSPETGSLPEVSLDEAMDTVTRISSDLKAWDQEKTTLEQRVESLEESRARISPFTDLNYNLSTILHFKYIRFRFGRIPKEYFQKFTDYVYDTIDTVYYKCSEDEEYVWIVYFVPESISKKIDAIYASMHFERYLIPDEYEGTPLEAGEALDQKIGDMKNRIADLENKRRECLEKNRDAILAAAARLERYDKNFNVRKMAASTTHKSSTFYILCGWMTKDQAAAFREEIKNDRTSSSSWRRTTGTSSATPDQAEKSGDFPAVRAVYPDVRAALLRGAGSHHPHRHHYSFLFGFMFGDAGQGLCLLAAAFCCTG